MEIRPHDKSLSNLIKYFPHRHTCITILLGLNLLTAFTMLQSKLIIGESRFQKPHNCKQLKNVDYYRKVLRLSYGNVNGSVSDN